MEVDMRLKRKLLEKILTQNTMKNVEMNPGDEVTTYWRSTKGTPLVKRNCTYPWRQKHATNVPNHHHFVELPIGPHPNRWKTTWLKQEKEVQPWKHTVCHQ